MELEKIRIFLAVADTRSFSEAARRLYISHSTTSRAVSALEEELGVRLIDREENRVVGLTAAGELLRSGGEALLRQADTLAAACAGKKATSGREK
ncbi:MAG: LysR family transcriptional regulator [Oscillospiraceae bacterium]|nr:LysR family transcriptional regulator [Oscillospiraceae bacterium]